jgi:hypothetical protein
VQQIESFQRSADSFCSWRRPYQLAKATKARNQSRVVAKTITVGGDDLEASQMIAAGLQPTAAQVAANIQAIEANRQGIAANRAELASQKDSITTNEQNIASNK